MNHKRVFIVHGWGGTPDQDWLQWLKRELEARDFEVEIPTMPDTFKPTIEAWVNMLTEVVGEVDENTYLVGHSIGCQAIMRYLETLPGIKVGGAVLVAAWFNLTDETWDEDYTPEVAAPWIKTPIDLAKVESHAKHIIAIESDNDPYVPASDWQILSDQLGAKIIIEHNSGHISGQDGITKLPTALQALLEISK